MQTQIGTEELQVVINFAGAEVCSIKNPSGIEFIWQANKNVWPRHSPVLFPIVGKLKDGFFSFQNQQYELGQHGFARDNVFKLIEVDLSSCKFELASNEESKKHFPFDFVFQIRYSLFKNTLTTFYEVENPSEETIYFSVGAHPGFNCPILKSEKWEDYYIQFEENDYYTTSLSKGLRTDEKTKLSLTNYQLNLSESLFDHDALVFENNQINEIALKSKVSDSQITLKCHNWPYFGIWSKSNSKEFICLEPWHGIADGVNEHVALNRKHGILTLPPKKSFTCNYEITIF